MSKFKIGVFGLVAGLMVAFGAFGLGSATPTAQADFVRLWNFPSLAIAQQVDDFRDFGECGSIGAANGASEVTTAVGATPTGATVITLGPGQSTWFCLILTTGQGHDGTDSADVTFDSNDVGKWTNAICANNDADGDWFEILDDECDSIEGLNTDELIVDCTEQFGVPLCSRTDVDGSDSDTVIDELGGIVVQYTCTDNFISTTITISISDPDDGNETRSFTVRCFKIVASLEIVARPTTVEIVPALSNTSHSFVDVTLKDSSGNPADPNVEIDFTVDRCSIETAGVSTLDPVTLLHTINSTLRGEASVATLALSTANPQSYWNWEFSDQADEGVDFGLPTVSRQADSVFPIFVSSTIGTKASAILGCNPVDAPGATPGVATITACAEINGPDICVSTTVTVIGPPASITVAASPTSLRCGEKSTITATVKDAIGQNVSDHTRVEMITNLGGVIAGQGAVAGFAGLVTPISSSVGGTFGGVTTAFLLTSESHSGPYEVVATTGGTAAFDPDWWQSSGIGVFSSTSSSATSIPGLNVLGGIFSTPPISAQVTVTCNIPAPTVAPAATVTAPRTGTGIVPPNTGDAGLASSSSSSWTLFAIGGLAAFALAGLASLRFARR